MRLKLSWALALVSSVIWAANDPDVAAGSPTAAGPRVHIVPRLTQPPLGPPPSITVDVRLTLIPVSVTDRFGAPVSGLTRESFRLFEDGVEQQVRHFGAEDAPVSIGVVFDASRSMTGKLEQAREAVARFCRFAMPSDEFLLIEFNDSPRLLSGFTSETERIEKTLAGITTRNWTSLLDAIYVGMHYMKPAKNPRKALLILSDGADNHSRYTESEMRTLVAEGDVSIYSIGFVSGVDVLKRHVRVLRRLSDETGGRLYEVDRVEDLPAIVSKISATLRNQYVLGFSSNNTSSGRLHRKVEVKLNQDPGGPTLRATWRTSYYMPD